LIEMAALIFATASFLPTGPLLRSPQRTVGAPRLELQAGDFVVAPIEPPSEIPSPPVGTSLALDCLAAGVLEPELASAIAAPENVSVTLPIEIPPHCAPLDPSTGLLPPGIELPVPIPTNAPMPELSPPPFAPKTELPSLRDLAAFCLPTLGIWLSSPLLSLIDTSVVGLTCATHHLAALAPSTKLCDYVAFFCSVIGGATTNLAAEALAKGQPGKAKRIIGSSLTLSLVLGAAVAVALGLTARPIMAAMLGGAGATSAPMLTAATDYTTIRALGYPAALLTMTLQSAFIATKDSRTPLLVVPLAAFFNLAADLVLVRPMGAAGAAWATTLALYANAATLLAMWSRKLRRLGGPHTHFAVPSGKELQDLIAFALPMMVALIARVVLGMSITLSAVALGTTALAANQVIESLYWLFCPFGEAISLCMQAYLPPLLLKGRSPPPAPSCCRSACRASSPHPPPSPPHAPKPRQCSALGWSRTCSLARPKACSSRASSCASLRRHMCSMRSASALRCDSPCARRAVGCTRSGRSSACVTCCASPSSPSAYAARTWRTSRTARRSRAAGGARCATCDRASRRCAPSGAKRCTTRSPRLPTLRRTSSATDLPKEAAVCRCAAVPLLAGLPASSRWRVAWGAARCGQVATSQRERRPLPTPPRVMRMHERACPFPPYDPSIRFLPCLLSPMLSRGRHSPHAHDI